MSCASVSKIELLNFNWHPKMLTTGKLIKNFVVDNMFPMFEIVDFTTKNIVNILIY